MKNIPLVEKLILIALATGVFSLLYLIYWMVQHGFKMSISDEDLRRIYNAAVMSVI